MINFRVDKENNVLFIHTAGTIPKDKMSEGISEFMDKCSQLRDYFTIINDMTLFKAHSTYDVDILCKISIMAREKFTIGKVIRIVGDNKANIKLLTLADSKIGLKNVYYVTSKKEALETVHKFDN